MKIKPNLLAQAVKLAVAGALGTMALSANALQFNPTDDLSINVDTNIAWGVQWRVDGRDKDILGGGNKYNFYTSRDSGGQANLTFKNYTMRVQSDDGSRNFDKWDQTSNKVTVLSDIKIQYKNVGLFLRPQIYYDRVPFGETSWTCKYACNPEMYSDPINAYTGFGLNNAVAGGEANSAKHWGEKYKDWGYRARFLDAYMFGNWEVGEGSVEVRLGRQVVNWGEATILQGGIGTAINPMDSVAATTPGAELKEFFLPSGFLYGAWTLNKNITFEAYWNYDYVKSEVFPTGSFFSMQDMITGEAFYSTGALPLGGTLDVPNGLTGPMTKLYHNNPDGQNQWGLAGRYTWDNGTELGVFIVNFHDKYPSFWAANILGEDHMFDVGSLGSNFNTQHFAISHMENVRLYGLTLNTVIGGTQFAAEYSYRANSAIVPACDGKSVVGANCKDPSLNVIRTSMGMPPGFYPYLGPGQGAEHVTFSWPTRAEMHMLNFGITHMFMANALWDAATLAAEVATWHVGGFDNDDMQYSWLGAFTKRGWSMGAQFMPEYKNVFEGVDLVVPIFINWTPEGSQSTSAMTEHNLWWSVGLEATYLDNWRFGVVYNDYSGRNQLWQDRDNISVNVKYTF